MVNHIYNAETASTFCRDHMGPTALAVSGGTPSCDECIHHSLVASAESAREAFNEWVADTPMARPPDPDADPVHLPSHYRELPVECIDVTEHFNFCMGNALKYIWRADHKGNPIQDLEKAKWYIGREIERRKSNA